MSWNQITSLIINQTETLIPGSFSSRLAIKASDFALLKPTWNWAGYFIQYLEIPDFELARIETKINLSTRETVLFVPTIFDPSYQLKFYKASWLDTFTLTIYEDSMPLSFEPVINIPSVVASTATSATVPISATSVSLLAANANRKKLVIANNSNQDLFIDLDATASVADHAIKIPKVTASGFIANYELTEYTGVVSGIWAATGTGAALVREML